MSVKRTRAETDCSSPLAMATPGAEVLRLVIVSGLFFQAVRSRSGTVTECWSRVSVFLGGVPLLLGDFVPAAKQTIACQVD